MQTALSRPRVQLAPPTRVLGSPLFPGWVSRLNSGIRFPKAIHVAIGSAVLWEFQTCVKNMPCADTFGELEMDSHHRPCLLRSSTATFRMVDDNQHVLALQAYAFFSSVLFSSLSLSLSLSLSECGLNVLVISSTVATADM